MVKGDSLRIQERVKWAASLFVLWARLKHFPILKTTRCFVGGLACSYLSLEILNVFTRGGLRGSPIRGRLSAPQYKLCTFESSPDLNYCDSVSHHRHLLAGKRWFLVHETPLVQGKKCWAFVVLNVFYITNWQKHIFLFTKNTIQLPENTWNNIVAP